jgi:hypothetical protein
MRLFLTQALFSLLLVGCTGTRPTQCPIDWVDFISFGGITYERKHEADNILQEQDLGTLFDTVEFKAEGNVCTPDYSMQDGHAAFLEAGTPLYRIEGYRPEFRLAASTGEGILLYEADTNPRARRGSDLLDIEGRVEYIGINSAQDGTTELAAIEDPQEVTELVQMVMQAPIGQSPEPFDDRAYVIVFHLDDGTIIRRMYNLGSRQLHRDIVVPPDFTTAIEEALP